MVGGIFICCPLTLYVPRTFHIPLSPNLHPDHRHSGQCHPSHPPLPSSSVTEWPVVARGARAALVSWEEPAIVSFVLLLWVFVLWHAIKTWGRLEARDVTFGCLVNTLHSAKLKSFFYFFIMCTSGSVI